MMYLFTQIAKSRDAACCVKTSVWMYADAARCVPTRILFFNF